MSFGVLPASVTDDERIGKLIGDEPRAWCLLTLMIGGGFPWGRYPDHARTVQKLCWQVEQWDTADVRGLLDLLIERGFLVRYECKRTGRMALAVVGYERDHGVQQYHRLHQPEFAPPPGWVPHEKLIAYLQAVREHAPIKGGPRKGEPAYADKDFLQECEKFCVLPHDIPGKQPREGTQGSDPGKLPRAFTDTGTDTDTGTGGEGRARAHEGADPGGEDGLRETSPPETRQELELLGEDGTSPPAPLHGVERGDGNGGGDGTADGAEAGVAGLRAMLEEHLGYRSSQTRQKWLDWLIGYAGENPGAGGLLGIRATMRASPPLRSENYAGMWAERVYGKRKQGGGGGGGRSPGAVSAERPAEISWGGAAGDGHSNQPEGNDHAEQ